MLRSLPRAMQALAAACAMTAVVIIPTASATAAPRQPDDSRPAEGTEFVDASSLPDTELQKLTDPVPLADYLRSRREEDPAPPSKIAKEIGTAQDADLRTECAQHAEAAKQAAGWIKSRFETCQKRPYDLVLRDINGTKAIGRLWFDVWVLGFAYDGSRRVDYTVSVEDIQVQPVGSEDATKWKIVQDFSHSINVSTSDPNPKVNGPTKTVRDETLTGWHTNPLWTLTYTSPDTGKLETGNQQRVNALVQMDLAVNSPNSKKPYSQVGAFTSSVRFDYAGRIAGKFKGTVFRQARVELQLSLSDTAITESTRHIRDAQQHPERTFPSWVGKSIPGATEPLHRLVDEDKQAANRRAAIATCENIWGDYSGTRLQCDEYPFASTKEGADTGDDRYSARLIDGDDNEAGGRRLNSMYIANRMLDGDPFYVRITS
ncbi:NucA/NucB deoxyribonuclease domain-containing protein [Streptomyces sp. NPDC044989]|uniref:NucA/NucB deoxyribonuclease domain-containing protein n=1 Tax=Streptomyces sp. NPDC044989 TaxID=3154336 RepID=UPI0033C0D919